jgi:hypothetical protein
MVGGWALVAGADRPLTRFAAFLVAVALSLPALAAGEEPGRPPAHPGAWPVAPRKPAPHRSFKLSTKAKQYFRAAWGVDGLKVTRVASGNLLRFNYRVIDPAQAAPLGDRNATPVLYAPRSRAMLSVPVMEKIGPLRQLATLKAGQEYWITFSNKGNLVRSGDRVNVVVGRFHADGLLVE